MSQGVAARDRIVRSRRWASRAGSTGGGERVPAPWALAVKRAVDVVVASGLLLLAAPLLVVTALAIRRGGGPALFVQPRVGRDGRSFPCYKFRSMRVGAHLDRQVVLGSHDDGIAARYQQDDRITAVGRVIRRWSLDELPQLWNVLRGHMSLIGPRPLLEEELSAVPPRALRRHVVRPGMTGLWQVSGRKHRTFTERLELDIQYVDGFSLRQDARIVMRTFGAVARGDGAL